MKKVNHFRESNFELLRIIAMLLIVFHHIDLIIPGWPKDISFSNQFMINFLGAFGKVGVNIYVLITGYFMWNRQIKTKAWIRVIVETQFYAWLALLFGILIGYNFGFKEIITYIFPILFSFRWFATAYVILYLLIPLINISLKKCNFMTLLSSIIVLVFTLSIMPTIGLRPAYSDVAWLIMIYIIGGTIHKYKLLSKVNISVQKINVLIIFCVLFVMSSIILTTYVFRKLAIHTLSPDYLMIQTSSFFSLIISIIIFYAFSRISFSSIKVNEFAGLMFGVYLIHAPIFKMILPKITNLSELSKNESLFYSYLILMPILVFIVFAGVEYLRKVILGGFFENYITVVSKKIDKESNRLKSKIENAKFDSEKAGENIIKR